MLNKKKISIISAIAIVAGIVLLAAGLILGGTPGFYIDKGGIHSLEKIKIVTKDKMELAPFSDIDIQVKYTDVKIIPSNGYYLEYSFQSMDEEPAIDVKNNKLTIQSESHPKFMSFNFGAINKADYIYLYVPKDKYFSAVTIKADDIAIDADMIHAEKVYLQNNYGNIRIDEFKGKELTIKQTDGALNIDHLNANEVQITNSYGDCKFGTVSSKKIKAEIKDGLFEINKCDTRDAFVNNSYGDVRIGIKDKVKNYFFDLRTSYGEIAVPGHSGSSFGETEKRFRSYEKSSKRIKADCKNGDIVITEK